MSSLLETLVPVGVAGLLGAAVGLEREAHGQLAGMRTNALVAVGAALFTMVGVKGTAPTGDPMRVAAQIASGIGFIGAGAILREGGSVRGVTTAAALWTSAALGMAAGVAQYATAVAGLVIVLIVLVRLRALRDRAVVDLLRQRRAIEVSYERGHGTLGPIIAAIEAAGAGIEALRINDDGDDRRVCLTVRTRDDQRLDGKIRELSRRPEIRDIEQRVDAIAVLGDLADRGDLGFLARAAPPAR